MKISSILIFIGFLCIILGIAIFVKTYFPVISLELNYQVNAAQGQLAIKREIKPQDSQFGIVIPKIDANAKIIPNVDPYNARQYQVALTKGIAHALGTAFPGNEGDVFLFSHSSVNFYEAQKYNSIFYLLNKMEKGDEIDLYYNNGKFKYLVTDKKTVAAEQVKYLSGNGSKKTVTLMTCWPPGTTWERLLVTGELVKD
ncbi:MAG: sortase [Candidatus Daviesbacteria bacterium]|nr:sortase [Candidatus Daviesbacteria bacterium]